MKIISWCIRVFIILVLLGTALGKLLDITGFAEVIDSYQVFPSWTHLPLAIVIPISELVLAAWLIWGQKLALAALVSLAMHLVYTLWASLALIRELSIPNCGCFGVFWARPLEFSTVIEDVFMVAISGILWLCSRHKSFRIFLGNFLTGKRV